MKKIEKENVEIGTDVDSFKLDDMEEENGEKLTLTEEHETEDDTKVPTWPKYENPSKEKEAIEKELA